MSDVSVLSGYAAAGIAATSTRPDAVRELLDFLASPATAETKRRNGMDPA